jgi:hypothetical protein
MATQLQVEAGYKLVLSTDEASTLQLWQVATINVGWQHSGNSGQQSIILGQWFSVALQHANSCDAGHRDSTSVVSSVGKQPYSGTSVLSTMPTEVQQRV